MVKDYLLALSEDEAKYLYHLTRKNNPTDGKQRELNWTVYDALKKAILMRYSEKLNNMDGAVPIGALDEDIT